MTDEQMDANQEEAETSPESSTEENEQDTTVSEDAKTQESDGKDFETKYQESLIALRKERQRRRDAEAGNSQPVQRDYAPEEQDDTVKRFLNVEATSLINNKLLTDPSFKERADIVKDEMVRTGKQLEDADNAVLARLFKESFLNKEEGESPKSKPPKQLPNTAIPEDKRISSENQEALDKFDDMARQFG